MLQSARSRRCRCREVCSWLGRGEGWSIVAQPPPPIPPSFGGGINYRADEKSALAGPKLNSRVAEQARIALPNLPEPNGAARIRGPGVSFLRAD